jgi:hypothetical protein
VEVLFLIPGDTQLARGYGAATRTARAMPHDCPHGHAYTADSAAIVWERCPCWPVTGGGHHLVTCRLCRQQGRTAAVNVPECLYLGF